MHIGWRIPLLSPVSSHSQTLPHCLSAPNQMPCLCTQVLPFLSHQWSRLQKEGFLSSGYSCETYNRIEKQNIKYLPRKFMDYRLVCERRHAFKKTPYWSSGICLCREHKEQILGWYTFGVAGSPCNVSLRMHSLLFTEPPFFISFKPLSYMLHIMICSSVIRCGNGKHCLHSSNLCQKEILPALCQVVSFPSWRSVTSNRSCSRPLINLTTLFERFSSSHLSCLLLQDQNYML